jgi:hypothetical protein
MITTIKTPAYWTNADIKDIERELVGLVIEAAKLNENAQVNVQGVRVPGMYRQIWAPVRLSCNIRRANWVMEVKWS